MTMPKISHDAVLAEANKQQTLILMPESFALRDAIPNDVFFVFFLVFDALAEQNYHSYALSMAVPDPVLVMVW